MANGDENVLGRANIETAIEPTENTENMSVQEIAATLRKMISDGEVDSDLFDKLLTAARDRKEEFTPDIASDFIDLAEQIQSGPDAEAFQQKLGAQKAKSLLRDFASVGSAIADVATAGQQIVEGEAAGKATQPTAPPRYRLDPAITQSINQSLVGISPSGIEAQVQPLKQDIADAYLADINTARVASGGQAGSFGALGQAAVNRRLRSLGQIGGLRQQIRESNLRNLNYALQNRLGERRLQQQRDLNVYGTEIDQFNRTQQAAGELERAGRINRRTSLQNLTGSLLPIADRIIDSGTSGFIGNLANKLNRSSNSSGIKDAGANDEIRNDIIDFDANDSSLFKYNEALDRDLFMNQFRGLV